MIYWNCSLHYCSETVKDIWIWTYESHLFTDEPDTVILVTNATVNTNCSDLLWVNLICEASDANPPIEYFQLLKEGEIVATSNHGTWTRGISEAKDHVYSCNALHLFGNVTAASVIVTFNGGFIL